MSIITNGLGGDASCLITQGYGDCGCKWKKEPHHTHHIELCPACSIELKGNLYSTKNGFGEKIFRCKNCYAELVFDKGVWRCVERWLEDDW